MAEIEVGLSAPQRVPKPEWAPLERPGCRAVDSKVLIRPPGLVAIAMLRFGEDATIDEHAADVEIEVICLEGHGFVSVDGREHRFGAGDSIRWPRGLNHRLWTAAGETMLTLMIEYTSSDRA